MRDGLQQDERLLISAAPFGGVDGEGLLRGAVDGERLVVERQRADERVVVARTLLLRAAQQQQEGDSPTVRLTQQDLADATGSVREVVSRPPDYLAIEHLRTDALIDSVLQPTTEVTLG